MGEERAAALAGPGRPMRASRQREEYREGIIRSAPALTSRSPYDDAVPLLPFFSMGEIMSRLSRIVVFVLAPAAVLAALSVAGQAGGNKAAVWKPFLPASVYTKLSKRSLERLGRLAKDDKAPLTELRAEALILAGAAMSTNKNAAVTANLYEAELLADLAGNKDKAKAARDMAAELARGIPPVLGRNPKKLPEAIGDIKDVMMVFANQAKGGEGIPAELHYSAKVKNQNGSEALINALAAKKLSDANVKKMSKELELLAYRVAVIGALTLERGPADKTADVKLWNDQAVIMRDAAIELAEAAQKKDGPAIMEACKRLENSCVDCHSNFK